MAANRSIGVDGPLFKQALLGSLSWLSANHEEANRLNVFPVPDGDTGTNMLLTLQSAVEDIRDSNAAEVSKIAKLASHGSLMGARGNSGVILSQIFRGFARAVEGKSSLTPRELAAAFEEAANAAYRAVNKPTEGTILTVAREAGRAATAAAASPDATVPSVIAAAASGARDAVLKTPSQLQILREAGVVDAGGFGLQIILEGMLKTVEESAFAAATQTSAKPLPSQVALELPEGGWGYFDISGDRHEGHDRLAPSPLRRRPREEFQIVDRCARALRDTGHGRRLREITLGLGDLDEPVGEHAAALAAERRDAKLDRAQRHRAKRRRLRSLRRCSAPITVARIRASSRSH